jgi:cobalt/nickel transport system permease protein
MVDALLSPAVGGVMTAVSAGAIGLSVKKIKNNPLSPDRFDEKKIPVMAVLGAFIFAGQMINFTIPGTGSSGHIGGGILLAAVLGPFPALLTLASVLLIQCLFFADGGLLAYGSNVFNLGVFACLLAYQFIYKPIINKWGCGKKAITLASVASVVIGLQAGAFGVVIVTTLSGITALPFGLFAAFMQPIHLAIGFAEGIITAAVLCFIHSIRPEILDCANKGETAEYGVPIKIDFSKPKVSGKKFLLIFSIAALVIAGGVSLLASELPDGLEWSIEKLTGGVELEHDNQGVLSNLSNLNENTAIMPDYNFPNNINNNNSGFESNIGTATAGIIGSIITVAVVAVIGLIIKTLKKGIKKREVT